MREMKLLVGAQGSPNLQETLVSSSASEQMSLNDDFLAILAQHHIDVNSLSVDTAKRDWRRVDFSRIPIPTLRECAEHVRMFSLTFTRMEQPTLNRETAELMYAIESEIRRRPLDDQFPEFKRIREMQEYAEERRLAIEEHYGAIRGWQSNFEAHLQPVFTNIAMKHLRRRFPENEFSNIFREECVSNKWKKPEDFELDGLIYDKTDNILYMIEAKYCLTDDQLSSAKRTLRLFSNFLQTPRPSEDRAAGRQWDVYFGSDGIVGTEKQSTLEVQAFLGFHSVESDAILAAAKDQFIVIEPNGLYYHVSNSG